jgi:3'-phosphoadenosine 5'-phosphosulfate sulfotransferase (PAPS reductase)/FAD synthetase
MLKGRFPSRTTQFCTERLKLEPINAVTHPILDSGTSIVSWIGERAEESPKRAAKPMLERLRWKEAGSSLILYRPVHKWTAADVFALAKYHGIKPNPLYLMGMGRVGCLPCINAGKNEISQITTRFPEIIARLREWEMIVSLVSRRGASTFFHSFDNMTLLSTEEIFAASCIDATVEWAKTTRGGQQFDLMQALAATIYEEDGAMCESAYGLCE